VCKRMGRSRPNPANNWLTHVLWKTVAKKCVDVSFSLYHCVNSIMDVLTLQKDRKKSKMSSRLRLARRRRRKDSDSLSESDESANDLRMNSDLSEGTCLLDYYSGIAGDCKMLEVCHSVCL